MNPARMGDNRLCPIAGARLDGAVATADRARVAEEAMTVEATLPLLGLRINAGPIGLRGITDDLLGPLADLAVEGISSPGGPPFLTPWKTEPPEDLPRFFAQYYWQLRAEFSPDRWTARWPCSGTASLPESRNSLATSTW